MEEPNIESIVQIKNYYGKVLQNNKDLLSDACCCTNGTLPEHARDVLPLIHKEVTDRFYGCGSPIPESIEGCTVLDLGCGTGRDCYILSKLVGPNGKVIGVDMTDEQLEVARKHEAYHAEQFGFGRSNIRFLKGYIEDLSELDIEDNSVDAVVSNCVINLSPDKTKVFSEILRVLKPGGELYFSDVFTGKRVPAKLEQDPVLLGECLGGALYIEDFRRMLFELGVPDYRVVSGRQLALSNPDIEKKAGMIDFYSMTIRAFKLASLEDRCEDYGQVAYYLGTIPGSPHEFRLDDHHLFTCGRPMTVCGNTASMLSETRYSKHFRLEGDRSTHFGLFDCGPVVSEEQGSGNIAGGACC